MKATISNKYNKLSKNGNVLRVYVYKITEATKDELLDFQEVQGGNYREDLEDQAPLFYHIGEFEGDNVDLVRGKSLNKETGVYSDVYKVMSDEMFELKRSVVTQSMKKPVQRVVTKSATSNIVVTDGDM